MKDCNDNITCPVDATINLIGGKYKTLILWHLVDGTLRYGDLKKLIPNATPKMLTQQLRELEEDNLIIRTVYQLSEFGKSLKPILDVMYNWGKDYLDQNGIKACCSMNPIDNK